MTNNRLLMKKLGHFGAYSEGTYKKLGPCGLPQESRRIRVRERGVEPDSQGAGEARCLPARAGGLE
jgi:hypothetical protein